MSGSGFFDPRALRDPRIVDLRAVAARRRRVLEGARAAPASGAAPPAAPRDWRKWVWLAALVAGVCGLFAGWAWLEMAPARALRALPPAQRAALVQRTTETLRSVCDPAPPRSLRSFCHDQAQMALSLPECDAGCKELARRHFHYATR